MNGSSRREKIRLIVNADDYGLSPLFNKAILELAKEELITSASVMIKRKFVKPSDFKNIPKISLGLHLELKNKDSKEEIENQIKKFKLKFKRFPAHLDSHYHSHLDDYNLPLVLKIAKKYNLPVRSYLKSKRNIIKKAGIKTPDRFLDWQHGKIGDLIGKTRTGNQRGKKVIELVFHPGYYDPCSKSSYNMKREKELKFMKSNNFLKFLDKFERIGYSEF